MQLNLRDTLGLGLAFWLIGYLLSLVLFFVLPPGIMGWVLFVVLTPVMIVVCWRWFRGRDLPLTAFVVVAITWTVIALVGDYLFIVRLFQAVNYYQADVFVYYAVTFLVPVVVGTLLMRREELRQS